LAERVGVSAPASRIPVGRTDLAEGHYRGDTGAAAAPVTL
jgi:hypothetical protein